MTFRLEKLTNNLTIVFFFEIVDVNELFPQLVDINIVKSIVVDEGVSLVLFLLFNFS